MQTTYRERDLQWDRGLYHTPDGHFLIDACGQYYLIEGAERAHKIRMSRRYAIVISFVFAIIGIGFQLGYGHSLLHDDGTLIVPMIVAFSLYLAAFLTFLFFNLWVRTKLTKAEMERATWKESFVIEARKGKVEEWLIVSAWSLLFVLFLQTVTGDIISSSIFALIAAYSGLSAYLHHRSPQGHGA